LGGAGHDGCTKRISGKLFRGGLEYSELKLISLHRIAHSVGQGKEGGEGKGGCGGEGARRGGGEEDSKEGGRRESKERQEGRGCSFRAVHALPDTTRGGEELGADNLSVGSNSATASSDLSTRDSRRRAGGGKTQAPVCML